ncbi:peptide deformylase [Aestuariibaculum suncheonense]|uniref:Peptide deformylase n=1 Tax=Aestuariibaculum suncheonense TaxID=1028745 RepID=A0A8J6Q9A8_9FLAO|nr:peptide deformylase [Aestuariibaculum suncheonense]MBD0836137.1 peptide deformylase [Aestuariibaculum suncheonense]
MKKFIFPLVALSLFLSSCHGSKNLFGNGFSAEQTEIIMSKDSLIPMRVYKITDKKDSLLLRTKSAKIKANPNDVVLQHFVKRLYATVRDSLSMGVGIAAPQVGVLKNIIWVQRFDKENLPFEVYLNPVIKEYSKKKQICKEGCLSIPGRSDTLSTRAFSIKIAYDTMTAEHKTETIEGFTSVIFQHEIDHLNGILYLDHLSKDIQDAKK